MKRGEKESSGVRWPGCLLLLRSPSDHHIIRAICCSSLGWCLSCGGDGRLQIGVALVMMMVMIQVTRRRLGLSGTERRQSIAVIHCESMLAPTTAVVAGSIAGNIATSSCCDRNCCRRRPSCCCCCFCCFNGESRANFCRIILCVTRTIAWRGV